MAKTTMKDVARKAGVSAATVSNVFNNRTGKTTEETRQRVLEAAKALKYKGDASSHLHGTRRTRLLGFFIQDTQGRNMPSSQMRQNPYYMELLAGIEFEARTAGYDVLVSCIDGIGHLREAAGRGLLEAIIATGGQEEAFWREATQLGLPLVMVDGTAPKGLALWSVGSDNAMGGYLAARHLAMLGHRHIAFAAPGLRSLPMYKESHEGFVRALAEAGLPRTKCPLIEEHISYQGGATIAHKLLKDHTDVTAVVAASDVMGYGIIKIMDQFGRKVPQDLSVVGSGNLGITEFAMPSMTTVQQNIYKKGVEAARMAIRQIEGERKPQTLELPVELIVRDTTKAKMK